MFDKKESDTRLMAGSSVSKVRYIGEKEDGMTLLEVALDGKSKVDDLFVCDMEQLLMYHSYGKEIYHKAATTSRRNWVRLYGASTTRSMSESSKCANSATDMITKSLYSLRSKTTILSLIPASTSFGTVGGGADRVSVKNRSEDSDCAFCSVVELVDMPECAIDLAFNEVKKRTGGATHYDLISISCIFSCVGVEIINKQMEFLSGAVDQLELLIEQSNGLFVVTNSYHCVAVDCGRKLIFDCSKPYALTLSKSGFKACNILDKGGKGDEEKVVRQIRRVIVDSNRYAAVCKMVGNAELLKGLEDNLSRC